jgi:hypothetical protein
MGYLDEQAKDLGDSNRSMRFSVSHIGQKRRYVRPVVITALVFLCLALVLALWVAPCLRSRGAGLFASVFLGSAVVAYGAWFLVYAACRAFRRGRKR